MANDVSLAATSAKVNVDMGARAAPAGFGGACLRYVLTLIFVSGSGLPSPGSYAALLGVLALVLAGGVVAYSYK